MPKRSSKKKEPAKPKRPTDEVQRARQIFEEAIGEALDPEAEDKPEKNPAAVALGRLGGLKGGKARAEKLSARRRKEIAKKAARARWKARPS
jgi:hypothetical protein